MMFQPFQIGWDEFEHYWYPKPVIVRERAAAAIATPAVPAPAPSMMVEPEPDDGTTKVCVRIEVIVDTARRILRACVHKCLRPYSNF